MSLNWQIDKIANWQELRIKVVDDGNGGYDNFKEGVHKEDDARYILKSKTHNLIFKTMVVGIGEITNDNWPEFYRRLKIYELYMEEPKYHDATPELIRRHIGLKTNVFDTKADWNKQVKRWEQQFLSDVRNQMEKS